MPVLTVKGMPASVDQVELGSLLEQLQVATGNSLDLVPSEVSVFFPADLVHRGIGEELICIVDGLFEKPERTTEVRKQMASVICICLAKFAKVHVHQCTKIEVVVNRFNQGIDGFAMSYVGK